MRVNVHYTFITDKTFIELRLAKFSGERMKHSFSVTG